MGQGYSLATLPSGQNTLEAPEIADLTVERQLGGGRFLKTVRARHRGGVVVAKTSIKPANVSFKKYAKALKAERQALADVPNVLAYQRILETQTIGLLVRQYVHTSLYDRMSIRPFLESIEKRWIAFQLLCAVRDCHSRGIYHGDIKSENVLVTSWGWTYLTDFSSAFKPVYLPEDNPADFSFFFDSAGRRTCYLAPERFLRAGEQPVHDIVEWSMDIFSLGCVIAELFTETPTFTLSQLFKYRKGEHDPTISLLGKIDDNQIRSLIASMLRLHPEERWHAQDYLDEYKGKVFPLYFYQHLHVLMQEITDPTSGRKMHTPPNVNNGLADDRIDRVYNDFEMLSISLDYGPVDPGTGGQVVRNRGLFPLEVDVPNNRHTASPDLTVRGENGTFILLNVITASIRSTARAASKVRACELLLAFAERLPDEVKLDRVLPYITPLLDDSDEMVLVAALRSMTQLLALVRVVTPINSFLFTQYIFPRLQLFVASDGFKQKTMVRATYAACLASLAHTAMRFLDMMQALRAEGTLPFSQNGVEDDHGSNAAYRDAYDSTRQEVLDQFEGQTKVFLTDQDTAVRRAFLTSVPTLCVLFGEAKASDVLLSHLNTYLNDPDWLLKCGFFKTIVGVAAYMGGPSLEEFILPLMVQALTDPQEAVVEQALRSLGSMAEVGLLQRAPTWELIDIVARFQMHPNMWIREAASHFISAATTYLSIADVRILVAPLIQPYLKVPVPTLSETELLDALKKPFPRAVLDLSLQWAQEKNSDKGLFWRQARENTSRMAYRGTSQVPPISSVVDLGPKTLAKLPKSEDDERWLGRLRNAGMRGEDEQKLFAFREVLWRTAQRAQKQDGNTADEVLDRIISLTELKINLQTVLFDNSIEAYDERMRGEDRERTIAEALMEASKPAEADEGLTIDGGREQPAAKASEPMELPVASRLPRRLSVGLRKQTSGSLSSSPSSGVGLLGREFQHGLRRPDSGGRLSAPLDLRKTSAEAVTDATTVAGKLSTPVTGSRRVSPAGASKKVRADPERSADHRVIHNYEGNDPTVLKLLDTVYVDSFPVDAASFGPLIQPAKRAPITSRNQNASNQLWKPQSLLVAVLGEHTAKITRICVAADHSFFVTGSDDGCVKVWDSARLERNITHRSRQTYRLATGVRVTSLCFVTNTHTFICTGSDGSVHVVKINIESSGTSVRYGKLRVMREWSIKSASGQTEHAVWSQHYRADSVSTLILATSLNRILGIDLRSMATIYELHNPPQHGTPTCFCLGRRQDWVLVGTSNGILDLWDLRFHLRLRSYTFTNAVPITRLQTHPSRRSSKRNRVVIAGGTARGEITVWDIEKLICHEIYRPAMVDLKDPANFVKERDYTLINLDDDRPENLLKRVKGTVRADPAMSEALISRPALSTAIFVGQQQTAEDSEMAVEFIVSGGTDGKVRFWDCERLDGCRIISGATPDEKPEYAVSPLAHSSKDTRVLTEIMPHNRADDPLLANTPSPAKSSPSKRSAASSGGGGGGGSASSKRYETIRTSAQRLLSGHLDMVTDVAVLERPFGMVVSGDRSGQVYVWQ